MKIIKYDIPMMTQYYTISKQKKKTRNEVNKKIHKKFK